MPNGTRFSDSDSEPPSQTQNAAATLTGSPESESEFLTRELQPCSVVPFTDRDRSVLPILTALTRWADGQRAKMNRIANMLDGIGRNNPQRSLDRELSKGERDNLQAMRLELSREIMQRGVTAAGTRFIHPSFFSTRAPHDM